MKEREMGSRRTFNFALLKCQQETSSKRTNVLTTPSKLFTNDGHASTPLRRTRNFASFILAASAMNKTLRVESCDSSSILKFASAETKLFLRRCARTASRRIDVFEASMAFFCAKSETASTYVRCCCRISSPAHSATRLCEGLPPPTPTHRPIGREAFVQQCPTLLLQRPRCRSAVCRGETAQL